MAPGLAGPEKAARGKLPTDVWWHTIVPTSGAEKTGYPTQKPEGVLRRIVAASSRPGDWCLDFFAGSGTLGAVAARMGRRYVLIDSNPEAVRVMRRRLAAVARGARGRRAPRGRGRLDSAAPMASYHVEVQEFPRSANRFNMSGQEIGAVLLAWAQERVFALGDQKWNPQTAKLTVIEGPEIPVTSLSMGRGWPTAVREGQDVTGRVLAEAREAIVDGSVARAAQEAEAREAAAPAPVQEHAAAAEPPPPLDRGVRGGRPGRRRGARGRPARVRCRARRAAGARRDASARSVARGRRTRERALAEREPRPGRTAASSSLTPFGVGAPLTSPAQYVVGVAQLVELLVVVQAVGGSSPLAHP